MAPAKQIPMQGFMLYMSGSGVQIFSMMVVGMLLTNPLKAIMTITNAFAPYSTPGKSNDLLLHKLAFIACQLACVGLGIYKCWSMGLLPTASSDWLAWREPRTVSTIQSRIEYAYTDCFFSLLSHSNSRQCIHRLELSIYTCD